MKHTLEYKGYKAVYTDDVKEQLKNIGIDIESELMSTMKYEYSLSGSLLYKIYSSSGNSCVVLTTTDMASFKDNYGIDPVILFKRLLDDNEEQSKEISCFSYKMNCYNGTFSIQLCN